MTEVVADRAKGLKKERMDMFRTIFYNNLIICPLFIAVAIETRSLTSRDVQQTFLKSSMILAIR